jgi:hypothetical protein
MYVFDVDGKRKKPFHLRRIFCRLIVRLTQSTLALLLPVAIVLDRLTFAISASLPPTFIHPHRPQLHQLQLLNRFPSSITTFQRTSAS